MSDYEGRGRLKVFLGYASRVGKSYRMLDEARRRQERGQDVVVAAVQGEAAALDLDALIRRHPSLCVVDGLAYDNPPGSRHPARWQDVEELLVAGISVVTALNLQHIREKQDEVERITGKRAVNSVPESFLLEADEIEVVDAPPEALIGRSTDEKMPDPRRLAELRELALLFAAEIVGGRTRERILVCLTPRANAVEMLRSGHRNAERFHGALLAAYVPEDRARLESHLALARELGAEVHCLEDRDFVGAVLGLAREREVTQIFVAHSGRATNRLVDRAEEFDVRLFPHSERV